MYIETFRNHCPSLKGVTEKMPFNKATSEYDRNLLVFSIGDKWFCFVNIEAFDFCDLKSSPDVSVLLQAEFEAVRPRYHMNHRHWISIYFNQDMIDECILELVDDAYHRVLSSLPKREQEKYK
ncbi:MAG: MmcQ/YjbR family DNA-binding protein [Prevotella nigrescens]|uniref:MmcQ/YjbR family DNA-binding protein n=1 Tax=Prevotella nigrescens TaxID=28133 RepID=A0A9D5WWL0_9BACT|nr:MmcQ/YjbR family DNA-binding protein [Prevotella nigrescens]MBF1446956.1 MmcQ/YjbR family DNA-binding protein [Prevotella nigrescens]